MAACASKSQGACHEDDDQVRHEGAPIPGSRGNPRQNTEEETLVFAEGRRARCARLRRSPHSTTYMQIRQRWLNGAVCLGLAGTGAAAAGPGQIPVRAGDAQHPWRRARRFGARVIDADTRRLVDWARDPASEVGRHRLRDGQTLATTPSRRAKNAVVVGGAVPEWRTAVDPRVCAHAPVGDSNPGAAGLARVSIRLAIDAADRRVDLRAGAHAGPAGAACTGSSRSRGAAASGPPASTTSAASTSSARSSARAARAGAAAYAGCARVAGRTARAASSTCC
jgi:hypothetical protein